MVQFDIKAPEASLAGLNQLLNPAFSHQPWYHLLESASGTTMRS